MKNKGRVMLSVGVAVFLLSLLAIPVVADTTTATRTIGDTTLDVGDTTAVTVTITTTDEFSLVLTEALPAGLAMSNAAASGGDVQFPKEATGEFIWLNTDPTDFLGTVTATYTLTATAPGSYTITGTVMDNEANVVDTVTSSVTVSGAAPDTTASRAIGDTTLDVGDTTAVTVTITTDEFSLVLTEALPAGLAMSNAAASGGDVHFPKEATGEFIWLNTAETHPPLGTVTASYTLTATATGSYTIAGTVIDNEENVVATVDSSVTVSGVAPPGETFADWLYNTFIA